MPLFHTAALGLATTALLTGSTVVLMRGFDPVPLLETIERERISYFLGLPIMIRTLMETPGFERYDLSSLELVGYAMAPMPDEDLRRAIRSEEHTSELQSPCNLVCRLLLEKKKKSE